MWILTRELVSKAWYSRKPVIRVRAVIEMLGE